MKKINALLFTLILLATITGCKKENDNPVEDLGSTITAFTNQTGEPNETVNGLQAQVVDNNNGNTVDFYGNFDALGEPDVLNNIQVTRPNSDTVVNFVLNATTKNFDRATFKVNGELLDLIVKFDFPQGDTTMILSHYTYDWVTGTSELFYAGEYSLANGMVSETPVFVRQLRLDNTTSDWITAGVGLGAGIAIAEIAVATGVIGGSSLVGTAVGAVAVGVAAVSSTVIIGVVAVGVAIAAISNAGASELDPHNTPIPTGTPPTTPTNPLPNPLPENPCIANPVSASATANEQGEIAAVAAGGTGGYTYYWSNGVTQTTGTNFSTIEPSSPGTYSVVVADENNCAAVAYATITEEGELSTIEKLIQWGPWRSQDDEVENNNEEIVPGFSVLSFSGLNCDCLLISAYEYTDMSNDQYALVRSTAFCIEQGMNETTFLFDEAPCETPPEAVLTVSSLTEQGVVLNGDGDVVTCTPF